MRRFWRDIAVVFAILISCQAGFPRASFAEKIPYYRLNLEQCFDLALRNNEEIKAAGHDVEYIIAKKIEATKRYVPVTSYKYRVGPVPRDVDHPSDSIGNLDLSVFNSFHVETGAPVTTFGRLTLAQSLADLGIDLKSLEKQKKADEVLLNVYKLYQGILLARELKGLINQGLDAISGKIEEMEKEETTDQLGILKLRVILYEAERKMQEAINKEELAVATLKVLMGMEDEVDFDIVDKSLRQEKFVLRSFEDMLAESKNYRPEFKQLEKGVLAKEKQVELEKKEYLPNVGWGGFVDIGLTPGIRGDENDNTFENPFNYKRAGVGMELSGKLDFRGTKSRVEQAQAEYLKVISQKRAATHGLELDIKKSYLDLKQSQFLLSRAQGDTRAAKQIVFLTKSNLDIGLGEKKDYLDALQSFLVFEGRSYEAIFNYNTSVANLKVKMGELYPEQKEFQDAIR